MVIKMDKTSTQTDTLISPYGGELVNRLVTGAERQELLDLIVRHSFRRQKVVLSSGKESDFYLDLRQTLMLPRGEH